MACPWCKHPQVGHCFLFCISTTAFLWLSCYSPDVYLLSFHHFTTCFLLNSVDRSQKGQEPGTQDSRPLKTSVPYRIVHHTNLLWILTDVLFSLHHFQQLIPHTWLVYAAQLPLLASIRKSNSPVLWHSVSHTFSNHHLPLPLFKLVVFLVTD